MSVEFLSLSVKASKPGEWELPFISYIFIGMCPCTATEMIPTIEMIPATEMTPITTEMIPAVTTEMIPGISGVELKELCHEIQQN